MIEDLLPAEVAVAEAFGDGEAEPHPEEAPIVARAVEKRRGEFVTGRACARRALGILGVEAGPILSGERGEPLWPAGVVGSITHCDGYRAGAVARAADLVAVGIDAEPHEPLPDGLLGGVARSEEAQVLAELRRAQPTVHWDRLLFSAKESVYKAWYPLAERWLGFEDATLTVDPDARTFAARLLVEGPSVGDRRLSGFEGRWLVRDGLVLTAIALAR
jgi:enterobactin synthetase component D / holo-[acyl-carrier protein] synthase